MTTMRSSRAMRALRGAAATLLTVALLGGVPAALLVVAGSPVPGSLPGVGDVQDVLTRPDLDGSVLVAGLAYVAWAGWVTFAISVLLEIWAVIRKRPAARIPGLRVQQRLAAALVGMMLAGLGAGTVALAGPSSSNPVPASAAMVRASGGMESDHHFTEYTVQRGDSLWAIAAAALGPGASNAEIAEEWPQWYAANRHIIGDNPDLIHPGMVLRPPDEKPRSATESASDKASDRVSEHEDQPPKDERASGAVDDGADPAASASPTAPGPEVSDGYQAMVPAPRGVELGDDTDQRATIPGRTALGIGALLAAALIAFIAGRRQLQRRRRLAGQQVPRPTGAVADAEQAIRDVADPVGAGIVDRALRRLAAGDAGGRAPEVRAARLLGEQFELYLAAPAQLPEPWRRTTDETMWVLPTDLIASSHVDDAVPSDVPAPYPSLVTLGHDAEGGQVLINLAYVRALTVRGPERECREVIAALAIELAMSNWADDLSIALVGAHQELAHAMRTGRLRHVDDLDALIGQLESQAWTPEVVLIASPVADDQLRRLDRLIHDTPQVAMAIVLAGPEPIGRWALHLQPSDRAVLEPIGLPIAPQRLTDSDCAAILEALRIADAELEPVAPSTAGQAVERDAHPVSSHDALAPTDALPHIDAEPTDPLVRVLGPVRLEGARGTVDSRHIGQLTEIATYIALHPGCSSEDLDAAIWPGEPNKKSSRAQACSRLRNWLGHDDDGNQYFPQMSGGRYRFSAAVRTDCDMFRALVSAQPDDVPTDRLEAALSLVAGQPFSGAIGRRPKYRWADRHKQELITLVADTAAAVAKRALDANEPRRARAAATTGLQTEPGMEQLWRYLFRAERDAGNLPGLHEAVGRFWRLLDDLGVDPEPETTGLLTQLHDLMPAGPALGPTSPKEPH